MLSLTRKTDYALVAMAELARRHPRQLSARELSAAIGVRLPVLTNILYQLLQHELLASTRGAHGGYQLAKPVNEIRLIDLIDAIEGPVRLALCCADEESESYDRCGLELSCRVKAPLKRVHEELRGFLSKITLEQIAAQPVGFELVELKSRTEKPEISRAVFE